MKKLIILSAAFLIAASVGARAADTFKRPDCSAYKGTSLKPESKCFRIAKRDWMDANAAAVQTAHLQFIYMTRPDLESSPEAKKAIDDKVEGSYRISYSVNTDGVVYDVKIQDVSSDGIAPIARLWADTISQWTFVKIAKPVVGLEYRRIYLYSDDDEAAEKKKRHEND